MSKLKLVILRNLNIIGGLFIGLSLPSQTGIIMEDKPNLDILFIFPAIIILLISWYYTFNYKENDKI